MATAVVVLEGVLANHQDVPIMEGLALYHALAKDYRIVVVTEWTNAQAEHWLGTHSLHEHALLIPRPDDATVGLALRAWHLERLRAAGDHIALLVDSNPGCVALGLRHGVTSLLFAHPKYLRPDHRPDAPKGAKAWSEMTGEINQQQEAYERDARRPRGERAD